MCFSAAFWIALWCFLSVLWVLPPVNMFGTSWIYWFWFDSSWRSQHPSSDHDCTFDLRSWKMRKSQVWQKHCWADALRFVLCRSSCRWLRLPFHPRRKDDHKCVGLLLERHFGRYRFEQRWSLTPNERTRSGDLFPLSLWRSSKVNIGSCVNPSEILISIISLLGKSILYRISRLV